MLFSPSSAYGKAFCASAFTQPQGWGAHVYCKTAIGTRYKCDTPACQKPQFHSCFKPNEISKGAYVATSQEVDGSRMHTFRLAHNEGFAEVFKEPIPVGTPPNTAPDAICLLSSMKPVSYCTSCTIYTG
ncbi:hypothetical protein O181_085263 [Austropuccinia psidii MF-1]|uniref:Uncharacterized protein n=1 Tax=Austropuccinia psidii MF-1 TaxID=1389203 RepID=A0A9Q3FX64_9BASI|nr:hypothetical protein [Austropuccinia psidii MF-1]